MAPKQERRNSLPRLLQAQKTPSPISHYFILWYTQKMYLKWVTTIYIGKQNWDFPQQKQASQLSSSMSGRSPTPSIGELIGSKLSHVEKPCFPLKRVQMGWEKALTLYRIIERSEWVEMFKDSLIDWWRRRW